MEIILVRKDEQPVSAWAGGTTTQLAIWPSGSDYRKRDFAWRLSSARVDLEESAFTPLPGYHRILMILEGGVELAHETPGGRREAALSAFKQDEFEGGWKTASRGRCVDFNLMTAKGWSGTVEALSASGGAFSFSGSTEAFYCLRDGVRARASADGAAFTAELARGDFLMFSALSGNVVFENIGGEVWGVRAAISRESGGGR